MVQGDKNISESYNVEAGLQPNNNNNNSSSSSSNVANNSTIDNRSILQPYALAGTGEDKENSRDTQFKFAAVNEAFESHDELSQNAGRRHDNNKLGVISHNALALGNGASFGAGGPGGPGSHGSSTSGVDLARPAGVRAGFEQAIEMCGYGKFHYILLAICGLVSTSEEMDVISMSFILPSAECDLNLSTSSKGWLNSIIFIGMMVGAYFWGSIADSVGRKKVLIVISFMNGICIVASSFSQTYEWFMLFRFLNGAALGGSGPVIWSYFAEFQPKSKRGSMLSFMAAFWTFGNLFVAGLAFLIIPSKTIGFVTQYFTYNSWRIFLMVCSLPSFLVGVLLFYLPESPKFLLTKGKQERAMAIFRGIFVTNTKKPAEMYPVGELEIDEKLLAEIKENQASIKGKYHKMMSGMVEHSKQLFSSPILKFTLVSITINFTFHIGYYGLMMWFPEVFNRFEEYNVAHNGTSANVCEVTDFVVSRSKLAENRGVCDSEIPTSVFVESLISLASALPANLIAILGMDLLGRKFFMIFGTMTAGICSAGMYFVFNSTQNLIVTAIFSGAISAANAALDCLITEVFPTHLRATGVAISMVAARLGGIIGNIVIASLLDTYCPAPTFIVAVLLIGGGLMSLLLPNTTRKELH